MVSVNVSYTLYGKHKDKAVQLVSSVLVSVETALLDMTLQKKLSLMTFALLQIVIVKVPRIRLLVTSTALEIV